MHSLKIKLVSGLAQFKINRISKLVEPVSKVFQKKADKRTQEDEELYNLGYFNAEVASSRGVFTLAVRI